jgi:hypothetical protein
MESRIFSANASGVSTLACVGRSFSAMATNAVRGALRAHCVQHKDQAEKKAHCEGDYARGAPPVFICASRHRRCAGAVKSPEQLSHLGRERLRILRRVAIAHGSADAVTDSHSNTHFFGQDPHVHVLVLSPPSK